MRDWIRLDFKANRFELGAVVFALITLAAGMGILAAWLTGQHDQFPNCFGQDASGGPECTRAIDSLVSLDQVAEWLLRLAWISPALVVFLGAPIVAKEIESGTAQLTWAFATSRARWLAARSIPVALACVVVLGLVGLTAQWLAVARVAGADVGFNDIDQRGLIVPARGLLTFVLAVAIGTFTGRVLPTILLVLPALVVVLAVVALALNPWRLAESNVEPFGQGAIRPGALVLEPVAILADGTVVPEDRTDQLPEGTYVDAVRLLPPEAAPTWVIRESAVLLGVALACAFIAFRAVQRRRPLP